MSLSFSAEAFETLTGLLRARSGLMIGPDKAYLLAKRLGPIVRREGLRSLTQLAERLRVPAGDELAREVVEAMTTSDSGFFRDESPFEHLRQHGLPRLLASRPAGASLRIWSAAAASGQEPYSIAMTFAECGLVGERGIEIVATDISRAQLARAQEGLYTEPEVTHGVPERVRLKYLSKEAGGWRIAPRLRELVSFREWNLLGDLAPLGRFDIVFCRYVLMYFAQPTRTRVLDAIARQMPDDGLLYLGSDETVLGLTEWFAPRAEASGVYGKTRAR